jgi:YD repeat-containing protein
MAKSHERTLQARGHWFEPSCAHQVSGTRAEVTYFQRGQVTEVRLKLRGAGRLISSP